MAYELPSLPYDYDALEPVIDDSSVAGRDLRSSGRSWRPEKSLDQRR
jgi:hypothetical protein